VARAGFKPTTRRMIKR